MCSVPWRVVDVAEEEEGGQQGSDHRFIDQGGDHSTADAALPAEYSREQHASTHAGGGVLLLELQYRPAARKLG